MGGRRVIVTPNEYLDALQAGWLDAEVIGLVRYDPVTRVVEAALTAQVSAAARARAIL